MSVELKTKEKTGLKIGQLARRGGLAVMVGAQVYSASDAMTQMFATTAEPILGKTPAFAENVFGLPFIPSLSGHMSAPNGQLGAFVGELVVAGAITAFQMRRLLKK